MTMDPSLLEPQSARRTMISRVLRFGLSSSNPVMPTFSILRSVQCPKLAGVSCPPPPPSHFSKRGWDRPV